MASSGHGARMSANASAMPSRRSAGMTSQTANRSPASLLTCPTVNASGVGTQPSRPKAAATSTPDDIRLWRRCSRESTGLPVAGTTGSLGALCELNLDTPVRGPRRLIGMGSCGSKQLSHSPPPQEPVIMLATELLFVYVYCLVDDAIKADVLSIPRRPGPAPACTDAELLTIALVRHLLGRRSENGFVAEVRRDWPHLFPHLPDQPEVNRRTRWLWGAFEQLRAACAAAVPPDPVQQIDTSALPVKHPSRVRGPAPATTWPPGSGGTARTPNGSTASAWPSAPTWAGAWSAPGPSCPPPSMNARSARTWSPGTPPASMRSCWIRASPASASPPRWPAARST